MTKSEKSPLMIGITGHKKSGKTTLIELLCRELTAQGLNIGTMKYTTHEVEFDTPGKDTFRHRQAGSVVTLIRSKSGQAIFADSEYFEERQIGQIFCRCDLVLIEGDSQSALPKIYVADNRPPRDDIAGKIIAVWGEGVTIDGAMHFKSNQISELGKYLIELVNCQNSRDKKL
jgi:molybdopterin-guanine dinucleotide biosynthesis adapter protein